MEMAELIGQEVESRNERYTQVFIATHDLHKDAVPYQGAAAPSAIQSRPRLSLHDRGFISFSYGGQHIEDFGLIASFSDGRWSANASAQFEDLTSSYEVIDGQFYWGTHFTTNQIDFILVTDGMTQYQLDGFKRWFAGGQIKELILAEHPNRAIMARVATPPALSLLPFQEDDVTLRLRNAEYSSTTYKTYSALYKGTIALSFVTDEPFWYSKVSLLGKKQMMDENDPDAYIWTDIWEDANGNQTTIYDDADALKIIYEDQVPILTSINAPVFLGNNIFSDMDYTVVHTFEGEETKQIYYTAEDETQQVIRDDSGLAVAASNSEEADGTLTKPNEIIGYVGPRVHTDGVVPTPLSKNNSYYVYYPGTAPCYPTIKFSFTPIIDAATGLIKWPVNSYYPSEQKYETITFESLTKSELNFTLPSAFIGYNQAISIFQADGGKDDVALKQKIRDTVVHKAARAWAVHCVEDVKGQNARITEMKNFVLNKPSTVTINGKQGRTTGVFAYKKIIDANDNTEENTVSEDAGDMIKSNFICLTDRNHLALDGKLYARNAQVPKAEGSKEIEENNTPWAYTYSYEVLYKGEGTLYNFMIDYKYMYY